MPGHFFFTDPGVLAVQTEPQAFGPIKGQEATRFRVTSLHAATADASAHAVCDGHVLIQPQAGDANFVNIVLLPLSTPPFNAQRVRAFIYRSVRADSLFTGSGATLALKAKPSETQSLLALYWGEHEKARAAKPTLPAAPPPSVTGMLLATEAELRRALFTNGAFGDVQAPKVSAGMKLGQFNKDAFGFEVLVEQPGSEPTLTEIRAADTTLSAEEFSATPAPGAWLGNLLKRESVLRYMDPCAFFGGFYQLDDKRKAQRLKNPKGGAAWDKAGLVAGPLSRFFNRNTTWLDLRGEAGLSFDYFRNYGGFTPAAPASDYKVEIQLGLNPNQASALVTRAYQGRGNPWPLLALRPTDFTQPLAKAAWSVPLTLKFPLGDNPKPVSVLVMGVLARSFGKGAQYPTSPSPAEQLSSYTFAQGAAFTTEALSLALPNSALAATVAPISTWVRVDYHVGALDAAAPRGLRPRMSHPLEGLFAPAALGAHLPEGTDTRYAVLANQALYRGQEELGYALLSRVGTASDSANHTFFAYGAQPVAPKAPASFKAGDKLTGGKGTQSSFPSLVEGLYPAKKFRRSELLVSNSPVPYLEFSDKADAPGLTPGTPYDSLVAVTISRAELKRLADLAQAKLLAGTRWFLTFTPESPRHDGRAHPYGAFTVGVRGIASTAAGLAVQDHFPEPSQAIKVHRYGHPQ
ncbi:hypothetical protein P2318_17890 [Myxococcaceae bacterium GXIMD 01537]